MKYSRTASSFARSGTGAPATLTVRAARVEPDAAEFDDRASAGQVAPAQRPKPREQFGEGEGFDEVVVGAGLQAANPVGHGIPCRQDQDRGLHLHLAEIPTDGKAVSAWEHDVEHDEIERGRRGKLYGVVS